MREEEEQIFMDAVLRPNRSLSPKGRLMLIAGVSVLGLVVSVPFLAIGAWPVAGFMGLDVLGLYWAFKFSDRQGKAAEFVRVTRSSLEIARVDIRGREAREQFPSYWTRVSMDDPPEHDSQVIVSASGRSTILGRFLAPEERLSFAKALTRALNNARRNDPK